jgi:hypothetical protein
MSSGRGLAIADLPVRLTIVDPALAEDVLALFAPMADHDGPYLAEIEVSGAAPARPAREPDEVYGELSLWRDGDELIVESGGLLRGHVSATRAVIGGPAIDGPFAAAMLRAVLHHVLSQLLSLSGRLVAHAAAVGQGGKAVLLLGDSGRGKSTSAYIASLAGWALLSDDLVALRFAASGVEVLGVHRAVAVPPELVTAEATDIGFDARARRRPDVRLEAGAHEVVAVAIIDHGTGEGELVRESAMTVARAVLGSTPAGGHLGVAADALTMAGALAKLPAYRFCLPDTAGRRLARVPEWLDEVIRA